MKTRPLYEIAAEIRADWTNVSGVAEPYLSAMEELDSIDDEYGRDTGVAAVAYFRDAARTWKGSTARRIKLELDAMLDAVSKRPRTRL